MLTLAIAAAHAPPALRLIGLFFSMFGALVGLIVATVTRGSRAARRLPVGKISALLTLIGLVIATGLSHRRYVELLADRGDWTKVELISEAMLNGSQAGEEPGQVRQIGETFGRAAAAKRNQTRFSSYLVHRLRTLGVFSSSTGIICWILELLTAAGVGAWMARSWSNRKPMPDA
ncbi:MAG: hypothetical protein ABGZ17_13745 [Planctomycetaceae bacterium]